MFAQANFVVQHDGVLLDKSVEKIEAIGKELDAKTGFRLYLSVVEDTHGSELKAFGEEQTARITGFDNEASVLIYLAKDIQKIDMAISQIASEKMQNKNTPIDKDKILDKYIIPFLVSHDKNTDISKYSAGMLNGYSQLAEDIAKAHGVELEEAIQSESKNTMDIVRALVYSVFVFYLGFFIYTKIKYRKKQ